MEKALQDIFEYHETTKHAPHRYARSLGYMDWSTQPDPFRTYKGAETIRLPLALAHTTPPYHLLFEKDAIPTAPLVLQSFSQFFQFSLGLAAWKSTGTDKWALRCNASSGNLQPTEGYAVLPPMKGISEHSTLVHYSPKDHSVELLASFDTAFWDTLPKGSFVVGMSSILWREAWKYGERSFRYCQLDLGHAWKALEISAKMLGWKIQVIDILDDATIDRILGLDQKERFFKEEVEIGEMLCVVSPKEGSSPDLLALIDDLPKQYEGIVNKLSSQHHPWEILDVIHEASQKKYKPFALATFSDAVKTATLESKEVVLTRRSVQVMDGAHSQISKKDFKSLLLSITVAEPLHARVNLVLFVHSVEGLVSGIYMFLRNPSDLRTFTSLMNKDFLWEKVEHDLDLYLLRQDDVRLAAKNFSCTQDIASESSFSMAMVARFSEEITEFGPKRYKELYWECGAIGQQLYLEATSLRLSATGIGCFLDDSVHRFLGLKDNRFQSLYHFTIGKGLVDNRLLTLPPYHHLD